MRKEDEELKLVKGSPAGMKRCPACGEYKGSLCARDLNWDGAAFPPNEPYRIMSASCLCDGIPCPRCKKNKIHRPGSNSYDPGSNTIEHWPWFSGMRPCDECRAKDDAERKHG